MTSSAPSSHGDPFHRSETGCLEVSYSCSTSSNATAKKRLNNSTIHQFVAIICNHAVFKTKIIRTESCYVKLVEGRIGLGPFFPGRVLPSSCPWLMSLSRCGVQVYGYLLNDIALAMNHEIFLLLNVPYFGFHVSSSYSRRLLATEYLPIL